MDQPQPYRPRCAYLTCKSMQVFGEDFEQDPEFQSGLVEFTCTKTYRGWGPDGGEASFNQCRNPERSCFREIVEILTEPGS